MLQLDCFNDQQQRLQKELNNFLRDPVPGMSIDKSLIENNITV